VAAEDATVLIQGESGDGKEEVIAKRPSTTPEKRAARRFVD